MSLAPPRWLAVRKESARILDQLESSELRDADLAEVRTRLAGRILGGLNEAERKLSAEIVGPLLVANSGFERPPPTPPGTGPPRRSRRRSWP